MPSRGFVSSFCLPFSPRFDRAILPDASHSTIASNVCKHKRSIKRNVCLQFAQQTLRNKQFKLACLLGVQEVAGSNPVVPIFSPSRRKNRAGERGKERGDKTETGNAIGSATHTAALLRSPLYSPLT